MFYVKEFMDFRLVNTTPKKWKFNKNRTFPNGQEVVIMSGRAVFMLMIGTRGGYSLQKKKTGLYILHHCVPPLAIGGGKSKGLEMGRKSKGREEKKRKFGPFAGKGNLNC